MAQYGQNSEQQYMQVPQDSNEARSGMYANIEGLPQDGSNFDLTEDLFDIPSDAYGAAILALVRDVPLLCESENRRGLVACYNVVFGFGLLILNIFMQFSLLGYVNNFVVNFDVYHVQVQFESYRSAIFTNGLFQQELWDGYDEKQKQFLCSMGMTNVTFYYCCIFCWTLTVMIEVRTNIDFMWDVFRMPRCHIPREQIFTQITDGKSSESIVSLTIFSKLSIYCIIVIPKFCICAYLLWLGCNWLSAAKSFESLVMNCVAMAFVVGTDEMLFNAVLPKSFREEVENLDFLIREVGTNETEQTREKIKGYNSSLFFLFGACCFVYAYTFYLQEVLPIEVLQLEPICRRYLVEKYSGICDVWGLQLNGQDPLLECYPTP